ncbi:hypothetical protein [Streptomyces sp. NPDC006463]|uniref:DUF7660 family protein n=1 Tax=Streptomyces sp. NPDC006463 TaxID=3364746 RepID=UPI0036A09F51
MALARPSGAWENVTLEPFLEAGAAWLGALPHVWRNQQLEMPAQPDWELVGNMVMAARIYE